jgi:transposase-like protein
MEEEIKRWTARRKSQLVLEIIQGRTTVSEASRQFDLPPSEIESWVDEGKRGLENALRAKPEEDVAGSRTGQAGLGGLVQPQAIVGTDRGHPASEGRNSLLSATGLAADGGVTQTKWPPRFPGRFKLLSQQEKSLN